ncbi:MAG: Rieske 2Fe-2S domain-containing protein [Mycobacteriales bacterium]
MPTASKVPDAVVRLESARRLDPVVGAVRNIVRSALKPGATRDALHGVWLGHPLHPLLTHIPIGMWSAAAVVDLTPGGGPTAAGLIATGCAAYVPTIAAGWTDWSELDEPQQRVGLVHAAAAATAFTCYVGSLAARARGRHWQGRAWSFAGLAFVTATGYLGAHLSYRQAAGVSRATESLQRFPAGWHTLSRLDELPEGVPTRREVEGVDLLVIRRGSHVDVLADVCPHLGAPLSAGSFVAVGGQGCVVCPWHGSTYRLADGAVVRGPSTAPAPRFETRIANGVVSVRRPGVG